MTESRYHTKELTVYNASLFAAAMIVLSGCRVERNADTPADTSQPAAAPKTTDTAAPTTSASSPSPSTGGWSVTPSGIGSIRVGMQADELRRVAGDVTLPKPSAECSYVRPGAVPPGVLVMLARGVVARVDVDSAGVRTAEGIAVGDSAARVSSVYAGRVTATPHKYVQTGQYLTVTPSSPADSSFRIVFETDSGRVTKFRSGRLPEVQWVERCG